MTRIIVAHRPETIATASRVIVLENGKIVKDSGSPEALGKDKPEPNDSKKKNVITSGYSVSYGMKSGAL